MTLFIIDGVLFFTSIVGVVLVVVSDNLFESNLEILLQLIKVRAWLKDERAPRREIADSGNLLIPEMRNEAQDE